MATGVTVWSKTAATNNTIDSAVNFAEGQAPSSVNDSARGLMASVAKWRDDLNGSLVLGGTSSAYTLTTNQVFASLTAGLQVAFQVNVGNAVNPTIAVDGLAAKPIRSSPGSGLWENFFLAGAVYRLTYFTSNSGEWIIDSYPYLGDLQVAAAKLAAGAVETSKIADEAVTYAKIQDVSATSRVLGRKTSGAGVTEELSLSDVLDFVGSAARGDVLIRGASSWTRLAIGAAGTVISSDGTDPSWGLTPAMVKIGATQTASSSSTISFTSGIDSTYRAYVFEFDNVLPATTNQSFFAEVSNDAGSSWKDSGYLSQGTGANSNTVSITTGSTANIILGNLNLVGNNSGLGVSGFLKLHHPSSSVRKIFNWQSTAFRDAGTSQDSYVGGGSYNGNSSAITGVRFRFGSGNIASGNFTMYGIK